MKWAITNVDASQMIISESHVAKTNKYKKMKYIIIATLLLGIGLRSTSQSRPSPFNRTDTTKAIRFYMDSLSLSRSKASEVFKVEHGYRQNLLAAMRDTNLLLAARQQKMYDCRQKREEGLSRLLTATQLAKLKQLYGHEATPTAMRQRWLQQRDELDGRLKKKKTYQPIDDTTAHMDRNH